MNSKEAIRKFRSQWREMAKLGLTKTEYFERHPKMKRPINLCSLCEYQHEVSHRCCLINWNTSLDNNCGRSGSLYNRWSCYIHSGRIKKAKELALAISKLPEL